MNKFSSSPAADDLSIKDLYSNLNQTQHKSGGVPRDFINQIGWLYQLHQQSVISEAIEVRKEESSSSFYTTSSSSEYEEDFDSSFNMSRSSSSRSSSSRSNKLKQKSPTRLQDLLRSKLSSFAVACGDQDKLERSISPIPRRISESESPSLAVTEQLFNVENIKDKQI